MVARIREADPSGVKLYRNEIMMAAQLLAAGWTPEKLREAGHSDEAADFSLLIEILHDNKLEQEVYKEKNEFLKASNDKPSSQHPQSKTIYPVTSTQTNFFALVPGWKDPEKKLSRIHSAFQRKNGYERATLLSPDASRDAREFFKKHGVKPWSEKRKILTEQYHLYVTFLQDVGLTKKIEEQGMTEEIKNQLREILHNLKTYAFDYNDQQRNTIARFLQVIVAP
jgi:hypothetical protein